MSDVRIGDLVLGNPRPLTLIAGPCQIESASHCGRDGGSAGRLVP